MGRLEQATGAGDANNLAIQSRRRTRRWRDSGGERALTYRMPVSPQLEWRSCNIRFMLPRRRHQLSRQFPRSSPCQRAWRFNGRIEVDVKQAVDLMYDRSEQLIPTPTCSAS